MGQPFYQQVSGGSAPTDTANIAVSASVQTLTLPIANGQCVRFVNLGNIPSFWGWGNLSGLTVGNGSPMLPNSAEIFALPNGVTQISVIGPSIGSTFYVTVGNGS